MAVSALIFALVLVAGSSVAHEESKYRALHDHLCRKVSQALPLEDDHSPVKVDFAISLHEITDVDREHNRITAVLLLDSSWMDKDLAWNETEYHHKSCALRNKNLWSPDMVPYNSCGKVEYLTEPNVIVLNDGKVIHIQKVKVQVNCNLAGVDTFSGAVCYINYGSWAYNNHLVKFLTPTKEHNFKINQLCATSKYEIQDYSCEKKLKVYDSVHEYYEVMVFGFNFRLRYGSHKLAVQAGMMNKD